MVSPRTIVPALKGLPEEHAVGERLDGSRMAAGARAVNPAVEARRSARNPTARTDEVAR